MSHIKVTLIISMLGLLVLAACAPAATTTPAIPMPPPVKDVAVTQVEEVEVPVEYEETALDQADLPAEISPLSYPAARSQRLVIKDAAFELLVPDTDQALNQVNQIAADFQGYILSSESWYEGEFKFASVTLAIPAIEFEHVLQRLRHLGLQVLMETASGQDVSAEYVDLESKLRNLEATSERIRSFLEQAKTVEESLQINEELAAIEVEVEQVKGQMNFYTGRAAFSTVTVLLTPEHPTPTPTAIPTATPTPTATPAWSAGNTLSKSSAVLTLITQAVIDFLIWVGVVIGPFALVFALLSWLIIAIWRRIRRRITS